MALFVTLHLTVGSLRKRNAILTLIQDNRNLNQPHNKTTSAEGKFV